VALRVRGGKCQRLMHARDLTHWHPKAGYVCKRCAAAEQLRQGGK